MISSFDVLDKILSKYLKYAAKIKEKSPEVLTKVKEYEKLKGILHKENLVEEAEPPKLPIWLLNLINENVVGKKEVERISAICEKIHKKNIEEKEDGKIKEIVKEALRISLKKDKGKFTENTFDEVFQKLWKDGHAITGEIAMPISKIKLKLPENFSVSKPLGENGKFTVNIEIAPAIDKTLGTMKSGDIPNAKTTVKLLENSVDVLAKELSTKLLTVGESFTNLGGYDWLSFELKAEVGNLKKALGKSDFSLDLLVLKGTLKGTTTLEFLDSIGLGILVGLVKIEFKGEVSYKVDIEVKDRKLLKELHQHSGDLAKKIEELPKLITKEQQLQSKARRARKDVEKVKSKGAKLISKAKEAAEAADEAYKKVSRKIKDYPKKLNQLQDKITAISKQISERGKPVAKAITGFFGKRVARTVAKFIPGLNVISGAMDVYDIAVVVVPIVIDFITGTYGHLFHVPVPIIINDRVKDFFEFIDGARLLEQMSQELADGYATFFNGFTTEEYIVFRDKLINRHTEGGSLSVEDYLGALKRAEQMFKDEEERLLSMQEDGVTENEQVENVQNEDNSPVKARPKFDKLVLSLDEKTAIVHFVVSFDDKKDSQKVELTYNVLKKEGEWYYLKVSKKYNFTRKDGRIFSFNDERKARYKKNKSVWDTIK